MQWNGSAVKSVSVKFHSMNSNMCSLCSCVTFVSDEVSEALEKRKRYALTELTPEVWRRSYSFIVRFSDTGSGEIYPFSIWVECDIFRDRGRIVFGFDTKTDKDKHFIELLKEELGKGKFLFRLLWKFGDGEHRSSDFNFAYGAGLTGIFSRGARSRRNSF